MTGLCLGGNPVRLTTTALGLAAALVAGPVLAQTTPYFVTDGDSSIAWRIQGGTATSFAIGNPHYPLAVRATVLTHHRDDLGSTEYDLAGVPTGVTTAGPNIVGGQQLDGADTATNNSAVIWNTGQIIQSNPDWSAPTVLFTLGGAPIAITADNNGDLLVIPNFGSSVIERYNSAGTLLGSMTPAGAFLCCLAYESATDSLWAVDRGSNAVMQINKTTGATMTSFTPPGFTSGNAFGGEMSISAAPPPPTIPTLSEWAMGLLAGLLLIGGAWQVQRRRRFV